MIRLKFTILSGGLHQILVQDHSLKMIPQLIHLKYSKAILKFTNHKFKPGTIVSDGRHFIRDSCKDGFINIASLQLEGKKRMNTVEFLRGFRITDYIIPVS